MAQAGNEFTKPVASPSKLVYETPCSTRKGLFFQNSFFARRLGMNGKYNALYELFLAETQTFPLLTSLRLTAEGK